MLAHIGGEGRRCSTRRRDVEAVFRFARGGQHLLEQLGRVECRAPRQCVRRPVGGQQRQHLHLRGSALGCLLGRGRGCVVNGMH